MMDVQKDRYLGPTWERNCEIARLRQAGLTLQTIAERYHLTRQRIKQIITLWNREHPSTPIGRVCFTHGFLLKSEKQQQAVLALLAQGKCLQDIRTELGLSAHGFRHVLCLLRKKGHGIPYMRSCDIITGIEIEKRRQMGLSFADIAEQNKTSLPNVYRIYRKFKQSQDSGTDACTAQQCKF